MSTPPTTTSVFADAPPAAGPVAVGTGWVPSSGGHRLYRVWHRPAGPAVARLLVLHGYGDHAGRFAHVMDWFAARGVASESFDFRGHGRSPGRRGYVRRWDEYLDDLHAVLNALDDEAGGGRGGPAAPPLFVLGHSHGGLVAAAAGVRGLWRSEGVAGCVLSAPYLKPAEPLTPLWRAIAAATNVLAPSLQVPSGLTAEMMSADPAMVRDARADRLLLRIATPRWFATMTRVQREVRERAAAFTTPLLCLIGDADRVASADAAEAFVRAAGATDKLFDRLSGQRHEILREVGRDATFERVLGWIGARAEAS